MAKTAVNIKGEERFGLVVPRWEGMYDNDPIVPIVPIRRSEPPRRGYCSGALVLRGLLYGLYVVQAQWSVARSVSLGD
jgi:hypothetical protein